MQTPVAQAGSGDGGFLAQLRELLREQRAKRARLVAMLEGAESGETLQRGEHVLERLDDLIHDLERDIAREERKLAWRAPRLRMRMRHLETEAARPQSCARAPRSRRLMPRGRPRARRGDDDPLDPPARVLYERAAWFRGDRRVAEWLEAWADERLGRS